MCGMTAFTTLTYEIRDSKAYLTLNRPSIAPVGRGIEKLVGRVLKMCAHQPPRS